MLWVLSRARVAARRAGDYGTGMWSLSHSRHGQSTGRLALWGKHLLLVAALVSALNVASGGAHCVGHAASQHHAAHAAGHHRHAPAAASSWDRPTHSNCSHCPADQCARTFPCTVSLVSALPSSRLGLAVPVPRLAATLPSDPAVFSTDQVPPTPPPQAAA
jgi:hypothetical protein